MPCVCQNLFAIVTRFKNSLTRGNIYNLVSSSLQESLLLTGAIILMTSYWLFALLFK
jgi:hypothetical protein